AAHHAAKELTREVIALGGTCTGEHGIGLGKRQALIDQAGESTVAVMRSIKQALDPLDILNPGKVLLPADSSSSSLPHGGIHAGLQ
ncbi:MAG: FAD-linked oxidase C-terminal domain-containing protein, partial [Actinomycetota bacterium]